MEIVAQKQKLGCYIKELITDQVSEKTKFFISQNLKHYYYQNLILFRLVLSILICY